MWHVWSLETACKKQERVVRRRHRLVISCARCRRLKVKCDRQSPCEHCKKSNHADECVYSAPRFDRRSEETDKSTDESRTEKSPESPESTLMTSKRGLYCSGPSIESWKNDTLRIKLSIPRLNAAMYSYPDKATMWLSKFRGETHWAVHMNEFKTILMFNGPMEYPPLPPSHPLSEGRCGDISTTRNLYNDPKAYILSLLFDKERVWFYVECYLSTVERIYRILHIPSFRQEVEDFWTNKQRPRWDWLAQFLMVIGIGYLTSPGANNKQAKRLLKAAEVCLLQMSFVLNPTIPTINALCMMVVAKHLGAMSCHEYDSCGPLMGIVIRHAMALGLHCDPVFSVDDMPIYEIEMRRRLWTTIVQLELQQSITSGTQPLLKNDDFNTLPPSNLNDDDIHSRGESFLSSTPGQLTDSSFQVLLASSFSLTFEIVSAANSLSGHLSYDRVTYLDFRIRELLTETSNLRGTLTSSDLSSETIWRALQISTLEITFRRILLILHLRYARRPRANIEYPKSYWSALECSLAILVHQRQIHEELDHHGSAKWFAELFKSDFFTAIITVGIQLCRKDNSALDGTAPTMETNELPNSVNSPRSTIVQTLKWCQDIWTSELAPSFCQSKVSQVIERIIKTAEVQT